MRYEFQHLSFKNWVMRTKLEWWTKPNMLSYMGFFFSSNRNPNLMNLIYYPHPYSHKIARTWVFKPHKPLKLAEVPFRPMWMVVLSYVVSWAPWKISWEACPLSVLSIVLVYAIKSALAWQDIVKWDGWKLVQFKVVSELLSWLFHSNQLH